MPTLSGATLRRCPHVAALIGVGLCVSAGVIGSPVGFVLCALATVLAAVIILSSSALAGRREEPDYYTFEYRLTNARAKLLGTNLTALAARLNELEAYAATKPWYHDKYRDTLTLTLQASSSTEALTGCTLADKLIWRLARPSSFRRFSALLMSRTDLVAKRYIKSA